MTPELFEWPTSLVPRNVLIRPPRFTMGGTTSLSGFGQEVAGIRAPFGMTLKFDGLTGDEILAWRAIIASLEGRAGRLRIPMYDLWLRARDAAIGAGIAPHSDGTYFSDGAGYLTADLDGVLVSGVQGQRMITADFGTYQPVLRAGQYFGLGNVPNIATAVWWSGSVATIRCARTLVSDIEDVPLRLRPVMIAKLASDDGGEAELINLREAHPVLELVEAFDGPLS